MFKVLLLICATSVDPSACQTNTALDVIQGPEAASDIQCGRDGQAFYAQTAMAREHRSGEYLKVTCIRTTIGKDHVG